MQIKVAEPNSWMPFQRYVWEQHHPGESADGKVVIFLDGDNRNVSPDNLECVDRSVLSLMAKIGHHAGMTRDERVAILTMARIKMALSDKVGKEAAHAMSRRLYYQRVKGTPEHKER